MGGGEAAAGGAAIACLIRRFRANRRAPSGGTRTRRTRGLPPTRAEAAGVGSRPAPPEAEHPGFPRPPPIRGEAQLLPRRGSSTAGRARPLRASGTRRAPGASPSARAGRRATPGRSHPPGAGEAGRAPERRGGGGLRTRRPAHIRPEGTRVKGAARHRGEGRFRDRRAAWGVGSAGEQRLTVGGAGPPTARRVRRAGGGVRRRRKCPRATRKWRAGSRRSLPAARGSRCLVP